MNYAPAVVLMIAASASATGLYAAETIDECPAEKYKQCASFNTSRTIEEHTPLMENSIAGFIRSKGSWKISVGYGPAETCAKVSLWVDMGPLDIIRTYERVFRNGRGVISDSGSFLHLSDDVESALRIMTSSCRVPDEPDPERLDAEAREREELEAERERLALEEERERLARGAEESERLVLAEERERLALEAERQRQEEVRSLTQAQRAREQEWERQWLARERQRRQRIEEERERTRLAELQHEHEQQRERERLNEQRAREEADAVYSSASQGIMAGVSALLRGEAPDVAIFRGGSTFLLDLAGMENAASIVSELNAGVGGSFGATCDRAQRRVEDMLAERTRSGQGMGMCDSHRYFLRTMQDARRELASGGCPAHALSEYDRTIAQASQSARTTCN